MTKIYIAGKISGEPLHQVTMHFGAKEKELRAQGYEVMNPLSLSVGRHDVRWNDIMKECIAAMLLCDEVHLLPGWEESKGATLEYTIAEALGMKIIYPD